MRRIASILMWFALLLAGGAAYGLVHSHRLYASAAGQETLSQEAADRFSTVGAPSDLDSQLAELDQRRALLGEAGWWRETSLFLLVWVVVLGGGGTLARSVREDLEPEPAPARS